MLPQHVPLVVASRGDAVESVFYGSIAVVDTAGRLCCSVGDADYPIFTRSTLKPLQALPLVLSGGPAHFGFSSEQIALFCASHSGEPRHLAALTDILARIGCRESQLQCGCHLPVYYATTGCAVPADLQPCALHHNCSGKHCGFLAWCRQHGVAEDTYLDPAHPLQQAIRRLLSEFTGLAEAEIPWGIDGCGAPNYAVPLPRLAHFYARLASGERTTPLDAGLAVLFAAMTENPAMVSGEGRSDLQLMAAAPGDWVAKAGADGVQALGLHHSGLGIALKIADGHPRAALVAIAAVLQQLGLPQAAALPAAWRQGEIHNQAGRLTGRYQAVFHL